MVKKEEIVDLLSLGSKMELIGDVIGNMTVIHDGYGGTISIDTETYSSNPFYKDIELAIKETNSYYDKLKERMDGMERRQILRESRSNQMFPKSEMRERMNELARSHRRENERMYARARQFEMEKQMLLAKRYGAYIDGKTYFQRQFSYPMTPDEAIKLEQIKDLI